jgi:hypothetical protein
MPTLSQNIFQSFRSPGSFFNGSSIAGGKLSKNFDEPTYLTFRLSFRAANTNLDLTNYDKMPHPLLEISEPVDDINARNFYSTRQFLRDSNEFIREKMLIDFIEKWNTLQQDFQWYFQSISGIDSLLKIDPKRGIRVPTEGKITLKMLEGLDLRVTHLLNLYRKIAWDDVYQRWILPDMMRYFVMDIYITEFRIFHQSNLKVRDQAPPNPGVYPPSQTFVQKYLPEIKPRYQSVEVPEMILSIMDDLMPTYVIHCERCEFDITSLNTHFNDLNVTEPQMTEISFDINVGTITEEYRNPLLDYYYTDRIVNGLERTNEELAIKLSQAANAYAYIHPDQDYSEKASHTSGKPFIETSGSGSSNLDNASQAIKDPTWTGKTINFGKAFAENILESAIGKAKMTKIPGLGVSFSEALAAVQSKNVFTVFGIIRQAMTQSLSSTMSSERLEGEIIDSTFRAFLAKLSKSEATDKDSITLSAAANQILNDKGQWEKIKDLSLATDLISDALGEVNIGRGIENPTTLKYNTALKTNSDRSKATDLDGIPNLIGESLIYRGMLSTSTEGNIEGNSITRTKLDSTDGDIQKGETSTPGSTATTQEKLADLKIEPLKRNGIVSEGALENLEAGEVTKGDIEGAKYLFGKISKTKIENKPLARPKPGKAVDFNKIEK